MPTQLRPAPVLAGQEYVVFFCTYQKSLVLLAKRLDGGWSCGSGTIDPGESPERCAVREIGEEFGGQITSITQLGSRGPVHDFLVELASDQVTNGAPEEHSDLEWFDLRRPTDWPRPWHPKFNEFVRVNMGHIVQMMRTDDTSQEITR